MFLSLFVGVAVSAPEYVYTPAPSPDPLDPGCLEPCLANDTTLILAATHKGRIMTRRVCGPVPPGGGSFCERSILGAYRTQSGPTFCGLASLAVAFESMHVPGRIQVEETEIYPLFREAEAAKTDMEVEQVPEISLIKRIGLTLDQNAVIARHLPGVVKATTLHSLNSTVGEFRATIIGALSHPRQRVLYNYYKPPFGEIGGGHFSPIAAYDATTDRMLLADVSFHTQPAWAPIDVAHKGSSTIDSESGVSHGLLVVEWGRRDGPRGKRGDGPGRAGEAREKAQRPEVELAFVDAL